jgi:hypothetical protein
MKVATINGERKPAVQVTGSKAWVRWLKGLAAHFGHSQAITIELALREAAKQWNYEPRPPRR